MTEEKTKAVSLLKSRLLQLTDPFMDDLKESSIGIDKIRIFFFAISGLITFATVISGLLQPECNPIVYIITNLIDHAIQMIMLVSFLMVDFSLLNLMDQFKVKKNARSDEALRKEVIMILTTSVLFLSGSIFIEVLESINAITLYESVGVVIKLLIKATLVVLLISLFDEVNAKAHISFRSINAIDSFNYLLGKKRILFCMILMPVLMILYVLAKNISMIFI